MKEWFAFYCSSRHEKKAKERLESQGFEVFLPLITTIKQWSDRKKKVEEPLIKGYIFVHCLEHEFSKVRQVNGIVAPIRLAGKYGYLKPKEKEGLERLIASGVYAELEGENISEGDEIIVIEGPLKGLEGKSLSNSDSTRIYVEVNSLKITLRLHLPPNMVQKKKV